MNPFASVVIETGCYCNASCPYCQTGAREQPVGRPISPERFTAIIRCLMDAGALSRTESLLVLYNYGEPALHPRLQRLIEIANRFGLTYLLCSNASRYLAFDKEMTQGLGNISYSLPGFSQSSYDRIQGLDFNKAKQHITDTNRTLRGLGYTGLVEILYHVYTFNQQEIAAAEAFADNHNIVLTPFYAVPNSWWQMERLAREPRAWLDKRFGYLCMDVLRRHRRALPDSTECLYWQRNLIVDEQGRLGWCCILPRNHPNYSLGNIFTIKDMDAVLKQRRHSEQCRFCIRSGILSLIRYAFEPEYYRPSRHQLALKAQNMQSMERSHAHSVFPAVAWKQLQYADNSVHLAGELVLQRHHSVSGPAFVLLQSNARSYRIPCTLTPPAGRSNSNAIYSFALHLPGRSLAAGYYLVSLCLKQAGKPRRLYAARHLIIPPR